MKFFVLPQDDLSMFLWSLFIGFLIAGAYAIYNKKILGTFVRALMDNGCTDVSRGKTLQELGFMNNFLIKRALRANTSLSNLVKSSEDEVLEKAEKTKGKTKTRYKRDFEKAVFYIPEERLEKAAFISSGLGTTFLAFLLTAIAFYFVLILCYAFLPYAFTEIKDFFV